MTLPRNATPLCPRLLLATANGLVGVVDEQRRGRPSFVRRLLRDACVMVFRDRSLEWHTAFVHYAGYWSHYDNLARKSSWPLPRTNDPNELADFARRHNILKEDSPRAGDVF